MIGPDSHRTTNKSFFALLSALCLTVSGFTGYLHITSRPFVQPNYTQTVRGRIDRLERVEAPDPVTIGGVEAVNFDISYTYEVGGTTYRGDRVDPRDDGPVPAARVFRLERPEAGALVTVHYNPADPVDAVLFPVNRVDRGHTSMMLPVLFGVLGVALFVVALKITNRFGSADWIEHG